MQDLINQLKEKFDLSEEKSAEIIETVVVTLRDKLPEPIASRLDGLLNGESLDLAAMKDSLLSQLPEGMEEKASGMLGKLFNK